MKMTRKTRYVAVKIGDEINVHIPGEELGGNYFTLCGLDGDDPRADVDQSTVDVPSGARVDCFECFKIWSVARKYSVSDFCSDIFTVG